MEHLHHFGLSEDPFRNEPLLRHLFESRQQVEALKRLERGVRQARGLSVLIGEVGSGKSMVVRQLLDNLEEEIFEAGMMVVLHGAADANWLLTRFARQLGVEEPSTEREGLVAQVYERLAIVREDGRHAVLIIDDAQALATPGTLSEVCGLLKLEYEDRRLLSLVLAGTPELERALGADPVLARRVEVKVSLEPMDADTARAYLAHRLRRAGADEGLLDEDAVAALHELSEGVPGSINVLADNAFFEAFLCGRDRVLRTDVERARRDLTFETGRRAAPVAPPQPADGAPEPGAKARSLAEITAPNLDADDDEDPLDGALEEIDSELEAVFETGPGASASVLAPRGGPPKAESEEPDLFAELLDD